MIKTATRRLTYERLREVLRYDPQAGDFYWIEQPEGSLDWGSRTNATLAWNRRFAGKKAGTVTPLGYIKIMIDYELILAHRLAWLYVHGEWPSGELDHINMIPGDNRIANLRIANRPQNNANKTKQRNNTSGLKGVSLVKSRGVWQAQLTVKGKSIYLGNFDCPAAAHFAYVVASARLCGEFARAE
jgi:hypothetical protein